MDLLFLGVIIFLFILAVFDLSVGVSNDASNFLNSAVGSGAAKFKTIVIVAAAGVFIGAVMSNGMMDIARHGIFRPEHFSFFELLCIFMAVMVTDVILLDVFNTLGLPTSTTVSLVFELMGATFAIALFKMFAPGSELVFGDLLNTEKALSVVMGIFLSVVVAFIFGMVVQFIARLIFRFDYRNGLGWKIGIFGGVCITAIVYFILIKGLAEVSFMTPGLKAYIASHSPMIMGVCFVGSTLLMQLVHWLGGNVLKIIVLCGTFALALAFAGNDLVNFIGIPITGFESYTDYMAHGGGNSNSYLMGVLNSPGNTSIYFLLGAGVVMVVSLATSKKARKVVQTSVGLSRQGAGDEMFGSSKIARKLVRVALTISYAMRNITPPAVRRWVDARFSPDKAILENEAAFDLIRGAVNLVLAGMLIAVGTSWKLPLSTTYVTFMVAMGTSLADRAWGRESAVFRITGVISVIGGWFITAGVAFIGAALVVTLMHLGGTLVMILCAVVAIVLIVRNNMQLHKEREIDEADEAYQKLSGMSQSVEANKLFIDMVSIRQLKLLSFISDTYMQITGGFLDDSVGPLLKADKQLDKEKTKLKFYRRRETAALQKTEREFSIEKNTWFHLTYNCCGSMLHSLERMSDVSVEHVDNNFKPLPDQYRTDFEELRHAVESVLEDSRTLVTERPDYIKFDMLRMRCDEIKDEISERCYAIYRGISNEEAADMQPVYVYLNTLQESQELVSALRKYLRGYLKMIQTPATARRTPRLRVSTQAQEEIAVS